MDGLRRKLDLPQFKELLRNSREMQLSQIKIIHINFPEESRLISDWQGYQVPIVFDFSGTDSSIDSLLWMMIPSRTIHDAYMLPLNKKAAPITFFEGRPCILQGAMC